MTRLPVDDVLPELIESLRKSNSCVLQAPTGAGKTTRVPPALLDAGFANAGRIIMLEPRRIAARAAARRIAQERNVRLGGEVGYQVRFDKRTSKDTRIEVVTEGLLLRRIQADPFLDDISAVIFDEFHERSLDVDLALALCKQIQGDVRDDLRIVVMSATLEPQPISKYLNDCPIVISKGRTHPVEIRYLEYPDRSPVWDVCSKHVVPVAQETDGHTLVFLPGMREIRRTHERLALPDHDVLVLHGSLPPEEQDRVFDDTGRPKVILSTNVAETSLTIPGVTAVVDSGLVRRLQHVEAVGLDRLETTRISKASADQRAGRAGRERPGLALRLWSEPEHARLADEDPPEIERLDLSPSLLQLLVWGEAKPDAFPWFSPPPPSRVQAALELLRRIGLMEAGSVTARGRTVSGLPLHPRLAAVALHGAELGYAADSARLVALLSERDPIRRSTLDARSGERWRSDSDIFDRLEAINGRGERFRRDDVAAGPAQQIRQVARQIRDQIRVPTATGITSLGRDEALTRALLAGFPDRVAQRRANAHSRGVMVGGRGVELHRHSAVRDGELFLCLDADAGEGAEAVVRLASIVERAWLPKEHIDDDEFTTFDTDKERVVACHETRYFDIVLDSRPTKLRNKQAASRTLVEAALQDPAHALGLHQDKDRARFVARIQSLSEWMPELQLPKLEGEGWRPVLTALSYGKASFAELRRADLVGGIKGLIGWDKAQRLDQYAPERIEVPSGSKVRLDYEPGKPPVLAVRIQEVFGMHETPCVAQGRVPVLMHLLAPNHRPQQVTTDLRSFWENTYAEVRKELRQRYPKHSWPEDPWTATPMRGAKRRR